MSLILLMIVLLAIWSLRKLVLIMSLVFNQFVYLIQVWAYSSDARRCCSHIHICALVATIVASLGGVQVGLLLRYILCTWWIVVLSGVASTHTDITSIVTNSTTLAPMTNMARVTCTTRAPDITLFYPVLFFLNFDLICIFTHKVGIL